MKVYKYLDSARVGFLEDGLIRFSQPGALNDPYECLPAVPDELIDAGIQHLRRQVIADYLPSPGDDRATRRRKASKFKSALAKVEKSSLTSPAVLREKFFESTNKRMNDGLGILSLSRRWNSALMWSHYTGSYTGFCVGFERGHSFFEGVADKNGEKFPINPVRYSEERMKVLGRKFNAIESVAVLLTKSIDWSYEEEERLVSTLQAADKIVDLKPYPVHLFKVPSDCIAELTVGHRAHPTLKRAILKAAKSLKVPAFETKISDLSFDVERRPLEQENK